METKYENKQWKQNTRSSAPAIALKVACGTCCQSCDEHHLNAPAEILVVQERMNKHANEHTNKHKQRCEGAHECNMIQAT